MYPDHFSGVQKWQSKNQQSDLIAPHPSRFFLLILKRKLGLDCIPENLGLFAALFGSEHVIQS